MTDRELLELAAKAAGIGPVIGWEIGALKIGPNARARFYNPLTDDGEALQLALKLSISLDVNGMFVHADCRHCMNDLGYFEENSARHGGCISTAARRAIVRAAASIAEATA